jgi:hypothetical protein
MSWCDARSLFLDRADALLLCRFETIGDIADGWVRERRREKSREKRRDKKTTRNERERIQRQRQDAIETEACT